MSSTNGIFTGNSRYASDFTAVIDRSVAIASLPLSQMNTEMTTLAGRSTALGNLDSALASLQQAITTLAGSLGQSSYSASVSNTAVVSATLSSGVREGTYSVEVTDMGSQASTLSKAPGGALQTVTDPASLFCHLGVMLSIPDLVAVGDALILKPRFAPGDRPVRHEPAAGRRRRHHQLRRARSGRSPGLVLFAASVASFELSDAFDFVPFWVGRAIVGWLAVGSN